MPTPWSWRATGKAIRSDRLTDRSPASGGGIEISSSEPGIQGFWSQAVSCKPSAFYRIEATITCDLKAADDRSGFVLAVQPVSGDRVSGTRRVTPGLHRVARSFDVRTYFHASEATRRVEISVGVVNAVGTARVHRVRFIRILEPDESFHPLAVPPPGSHYVPPRIVHTVTLCSDKALDRPIRYMLTSFFGGPNVRTIALGEFDERSVASSDAVLLPDDTPPQGVRSLSALLALARERIVVVSLPAFASLNRKSIALRRIVQPDDPIHAKVVFSDHATRGFALHDTFPYAWGGKTEGSFAQNQFRATKPLKAYCRRHRFEVLLESCCDRDSTSDQPICLYRRTENGGLFVLDIEPVEAADSSFNEPTLAAHLLLSILGRHQALAGQYCVPMRSEGLFRETIREAANRWANFVVHDDDVPADRVTGQLVTVGAEDQTFGLPLSPKPVVLIRSGVRAGDTESAFGVLSWFRQLLRTEPNRCPYAHALASRFRLAWVPFVSSWESRDGWQRTDRPPQNPMVVEGDGAKVEALIDVVSCPVQRVRVVFARTDAMFQAAANWLPRLFTAFSSDGFFAFAADHGGEFTDRSHDAWRRVRLAVQVAAEFSAFPDEAHRSVLAIGGNVIRIEIPGSDSDYSANSIIRSDLAVKLLEGVIGLHYGLIAVNRGSREVSLDGYSPVKPGETLVSQDRRLNSKDRSTEFECTVGRC